MHSAAGNGVCCWCGWRKSWRAFGSFSWWAWTQERTGCRDGASAGARGIAGRRGGGAATQPLRSTLGALCRAAWPQGMDAAAGTPGRGARFHSQPLEKRERQVRRVDFWIRLCNMLRLQPRTLIRSPSARGDSLRHSSSRSGPLTVADSTLAISQGAESPTRIWRSRSGLHAQGRPTSFECQRRRAANAPNSQLRMASV